MTDPKRARCYDKDWVYVKEESTDLAKTFERIREQMKQAETLPKPPANVKQLHQPPATERKKAP